MGKDDHAVADRNAMIGTIAIGTIVAVIAVASVIYLRLSLGWTTSFEIQPVMMILSVVLLALFYAAALVSLANVRETGRTVSGWLDVLSLMVLTGVLAYLIFGGFLYVSLVILLCCAFVVYVHLAQGA